MLTSIPAGSTTCSRQPNTGRGGAATPEHQEREAVTPVGQAGFVRNPMFVPDDQLASLIFDYFRDRLALDPVALDFPGDKAVLDKALAGLLRSEPQDPGKVLRVFADQLAPAVISCDSPRFFAFIPAAPTKAS